MSLMDGIQRFHGWSGAGYVLDGRYPAVPRMEWSRCWSLIADEAIVSACHLLVIFTAILVSASKVGSDHRSDPKLRSNFNALVSDHRSDPKLRSKFNALVSDHRSDPKLRSKFNALVSDLWSDTTVPPST